MCNKPKGAENNEFHKFLLSDDLPSAYLVKVLCYNFFLGIKVGKRVKKQTFFFSCFCHFVCSITTRSKESQLLKKFSTQNVKVGNVSR